MEIVLERRGVTGHRLFQHLRLFAFVQHFGQEPQVVVDAVEVYGQTVTSCSYVKVVSYMSVCC